MIWLLIDSPVSESICVARDDRGSWLLAQVISIPSSERQQENKVPQGLGDARERLMRVISKNHRSGPSRIVDLPLS